MSLLKKQGMLRHGLGRDLRERLGRDGPMEGFLPTLHAATAFL